MSAPKMDPKGLEIAREALRAEFFARGRFSSRELARVAIRAYLAATQPEEKHGCACGIPGVGLERECHGDYYDGETFAIDSGGEYGPTNVCACSCHAEPGAAKGEA